MYRTISDYKITKRKDGRYYVRIRDRGDITHIYGKTKAEVKAKLEIKIEELNTLDRRRTEQSFPTRNITLGNWARLCPFGGRLCFCQLDQHSTVQHKALCF